MLHIPWGCGTTHIIVQHNIFEWPQNIASTKIYRICNVQREQKLTLCTRILFHEVVRRSGLFQSVNYLGLLPTSFTGYQCPQGVNSKPLPYSLNTII